MVIGSDDQARLGALPPCISAFALRSWSPTRPRRDLQCGERLPRTKLSFTNAIAAVCEAVGADVNDVLLGMGYDIASGMSFFVPGRLGRFVFPEGLEGDHLDR